MRRYFMNPQNQYIEPATTGWSWLWAFLFSFVYFAVRGAWVAAFAFFVVGILLEAIHWALYIPLGIAAAVMCQAIVSRTYLRCGWIEVEHPGVRARAGAPKPDLAGSNGPRFF